jgi:ubiquinone biosynthesis protein COQ4
MKEGAMETLTRAATPTATPAAIRPAAPATDERARAALEDETRAVRAAMEGGPWARARVAVGALRRLVADVNDTRQVLVLSLALNAPRLPELLSRFLAADDGVALMQEQPSIDSRGVDYAWLRTLSADTLGGAYVRMLDSAGLDPDLFQPPPGLPREHTYLAQRMRQSHDLWHVVTGYRTDVPGEIELLAFSHAQTRMPSFLVLVVGGLLRYGLAHRDLFRRVRAAHRRGRRARFLPPVRWERHWQTPLVELRAALGLG